MKKIICKLLGHKYMEWKNLGDNLWSHKCERCRKKEIVSDFVKGFYKTN